MVPSSSEWVFLSPWSLALSVREITSVSATFLLASLPNSLSADSSNRSLTLATQDPEDCDDEDYRDDVQLSKDASMFDTVAKDLVITVNDTPWQHVLIRTDDQADEAAIVIYGLMPGRQYDIQLGLVHGSPYDTISRQVTTEAGPQVQGEEGNTASKLPAIGPPSESVQLSIPPSSTSLAHSASATSISPSMSTHPTPASAPTPPPPTLNERLHQLQHALSLLTSERESLTASLKVVRRDSQKADAALRSEIDILKRASEKHGAAEHRAKQKTLALQEAVKRAQTGTQEIEEMIKEVEGNLPALDAQRGEKEGEYKKVKEAAGKVEREWEEKAEKERKRVDGMKAELTSLSNKLDRLNGKREKLEGSVVVDLEEQLREIEKEIERVEAEPSYSSSDDPTGDNHLSAEQIQALFPHQGQLSPQKGRTAGLIFGRPSPVPIQRPLLQPSGTSPAGVWGSSSGSSCRSQPQPPRPPPHLLQHPHMRHQSSPPRPSEGGVAAQQQVGTSILSTRAPPFAPAPQWPANSAPIHRQRPAPSVGAHAKWSFDVPARDGGSSNASG